MEIDRAEIESCAEAMRPLAEVNDQVDQHLLRAHRIRQARTESLVGSLEKSRAGLHSDNESAPTEKDVEPLRDEQWRREDPLSYLTIVEDGALDGLSALEKSSRTVQELLERRLHLGKELATHEDPLVREMLVAIQEAGEVYLDETELASKRGFFREAFEDAMSDFADLYASPSTRQLALDLIREDV